jgi:YidC/Oxa1 family membrane protein insertase
MDKRTVLAFALIALVFFAWSYFFGPSPKPPATTAADTSTTARPPAPIAPEAPRAPAPQLPAKYQQLAAGANRYVTIETPLYRATLNSRGGTLARFELRKYKTWYGAPVQLISDSAGFPGVLGIEYVGRDGAMVSTRDLNYTIDAPTDATISGNDSIVVTARLALDGVAAAATDSTAGASGDTASGTPQTAGSGGVIEKRFVFRAASYGIGFGVAMRNMASEVGGGAYRIRWEKGLKYQEHNSVDESSKARAFVTSSEELKKVDASSHGEAIHDTTRGTIDWVGVTSKYFGAALLPKKPIANAAVIIAGTNTGADSGGVVESYDIALQVPLKQATEAQEFTLFVGPLAHDIVKPLGIGGMVDMGFELIVRPIGEFFMLPFFQFLHSFISNFGVVIIVFSLVIRLLLWPLSVPQIRSSRKMQLLQPKIAEIRERHKDDPQQQQMETMKVYREYGINPVGGCLPLVLQLPILYALWATLSSAIDIRQESFMLWIHDLSIPDAVIHLPFSLPLLGNFISGLALVMGITLFVQQKMMITDPKQKAMVYIMPVMLTLMFNHLPSGLNLYYLTFNLLSIGQQVYMTKFSKNTLTLEDLRKEASTKKKGWLSSKLEEAQKIAEMQQKTGAGAKSTSTTGTTSRNGGGRDAKRLK